MKFCALECNIQQYDLYLTSTQLRNLSDDSVQQKSTVYLYFDSVSYLNYEESPSISV